MAWLTRHASRDDGFTLSEMVVVVALMGTVLGVAWAGLSVINKAATISESSASAARDAAGPVEQISKSLMQNNIVNASDFAGNNQTGAQAINVWTNPSMGPNPQLDSFVTVLGTNGNYNLLWNKTVTGSDMSTVVSRNTWVMSYNNVNKKLGVPLFTYYDASGTVLPYPVSGGTSTIPSSARSVLVRVVAALPDSRTVEASRTVYFRNRN